MTNLICKVEKVLEQSKAAIAQYTPNSADTSRCLGSADAGTGSDGCEQLRSELVEAYDCVCSVASWSVLREFHTPGNPENLALKGKK